MSTAQTPVLRSGRMLDNVEVAVLTRLNTLAERHGLKPYDFVATVRDGEDAEALGFALYFEAFANRNPLCLKRFEKMLANLGIVSGSTPALKGKLDEIIDSLDNALSHYP